MEGRPYETRGRRTLWQISAIAPAAEVESFSAELTICAAGQTRHEAENGRWAIKEWVTYMATKFSWGPLPRGIYIAMLWFTVVIGWCYPNFLIYYIPLLLFLGIGLRPLIEVTGLYDLLQYISVKIDDKRWDKITEKRRLAVYRKERDKKYRNMRTNDPRLPKNW